MAVTLVTMALTAKKRALPLVSKTIGVMSMTGNVHWAARKVKEVLDVHWIAQELAR